MGLAEHLAVGNIGRAAFGPSRYVVRVHLANLPNPLRARIVPDRAQRAIRNAALFRLGSLPRIDLLLLLVAEHAHVEKPRFLLSAKHILENAAPVRHELVAEKLLDAPPDFLRDLVFSRETQRQSWSRELEFELEFELENGIFLPFLKGTGNSSPFALTCRQIP